VKKVPEIYVRGRYINLIERRKKNPLNALLLVAHKQLKVNSSFHQNCIRFITPHGIFSSKCINKNKILREFLFHQISAISHHHQQTYKKAQTN
jgi:hypothetical protein